ncbi:hypothetical protein FOG51_01870 [Hanseniaspora uvarum]|jgi:25S rRNA (cytosine2278-C5)-methyltransferase|nr:hypothetical protein FOG48_00599 [Hanseniaspora uvarum]KAF0272994.1 hypothetical protein FOG51_01870 [Hanseniaspora uvarum]GMM42451.1 rRNA (cytosine-C5-)-methyltransferase [Hanseniaspora uvarum]
MEIYRDSTWILEDLIKQKENNKLVSGSLKNIIISKHKQFKLNNKNLKNVFACTIEAYKHLDVLEYLYENMSSLEAALTKLEATKGKVPNKVTLYLMFNDALFSKNKRIQLPNNHYLKKFMDSINKNLNKQWEMFKKINKVNSIDEYLAKKTGADKPIDQPPVRWFRLNLAKLRTFEKINQVKNEIIANFKHNVDSWKAVQENQDCIYEDEFIPNLFAVSMDFKISKCKWYKSGQIIIQDRGSCFPLEILDVKKTDYIMDCCAAPGNKTSLLGGYIYVKDRLESVDEDAQPIYEEDEDSIPRVVAFEKNDKRSDVLNTMMKNAGFETRKFNPDLTVSEQTEDYFNDDTLRIDIFHGDFSTLCNNQRNNDIYKSKFFKFNKAILDPSCSGSGIYGRQSIDNLNKVDMERYTEKEGERLAKLSSFQTSLVSHAMKLPTLQKLTYSTCSVNTIENEDVVIDLLMKHPDWEVIPKSESIPTWKRRGLDSAFEKYIDGEDCTLKGMSVKELLHVKDACIRLNKEEDGGIGFFVCGFQRKQLKKTKKGKK